MADLRPVLRIRALDASGAPDPVALTSGGLTLGRSEDNSLTVDSERWPAASGHHCRIDVRGDSGWVTDLASSNGTLLNDQPVREARLAPGDVLQLGARGPRFLVLGPTGLAETVVIDRKQMGLDAGLSETRVHTLVRRKTRRNAAIFGLLLALLLASGAWAWWEMDERRRADQASGRQSLEAAEDNVRVHIQELRETRNAQAHLQQQELDRMRAEYRAELEARETERDELLARIAQLEAEALEGDELAALRDQIERNKQELVAASRRVDGFDPVSLEQVRLEAVSRARSSVVLLETSLSFRNRVTGAVMHLADPALGMGPNFDDVGVVFAIESTGSGFCVSPEGWILTNRHVVTPSDASGLLEAVAMLPEIEPVFEVQVVFTDSDVRLPAEVVRVDGDDDLALLRVAPFEGMPFIEDFSLDAPLPPPGADVYVMGFPLGTFALQEGDRVIASTFRGIFSRAVDGTMQVDAAVHPGNSGGPILDGAGRVVGVVFSVQAAPDQTAVYTIGYGIPIERAEEVWPPRPEQGPTAPDGDEAIQAPEDGDETLEGASSAAPGPADEEG